MQIKLTPAVIATFFIAVLPFVATAHQLLKQQSNKKPLFFIENKGQIIDQYNNPRTDIDFKINSNGAVLFAGSGRLHYQWYKTSKLVSAKQQANGTLQFDTTASEINTYRMDVTLIGANMEVAPIKEEIQNYHENYYLPQCPNGVAAYSYTRVTYPNVYPGIDWVLYTENGSVKYDFVVHAGADANKIQLQYNGATKMVLEDGALVATTPMGSITEAAPYTYDATTGKQLACSYSLSGNKVKFILSPHEGSLVIDPKLNWGTYYGAATTSADNTDLFLAMKADTTGRVAAGGQTNNPYNIATLGAQQMTLAAKYDGMVILFDTDVQPLWCTYYGGAEGEMFCSITINAQGDVFAGGFTQSSGLGTTGTEQPMLASTTYLNPNALLVKFDELTGQRIWATYLGGATESAMIFSMACDTAGNVYAGGVTDCSTNIATPGAFITSLPAGMDSSGFLIKYTGNAGTRIWGTYFRGQVSNIATSKYDHLYISGLTRFTTGVTTPGAFAATYPVFIGTSYVFYFARFNSAGTRIWSSYTLDPGLSSPSGSIGPGIACDAVGNLYVSASTWTTTGIATVGTHQSTFGGGIDAFLWKFREDGTRVWGTYYGNSDLQFGSNHLGISEAGDIYLAGQDNSISSSGITTANAHKLTYKPGINNMYLSVFSPYGKLKYGTYYGDAAESEEMVTYGKGNIYIGGNTQSTQYIATAGSYQPVWGGGDDGFVAQFAADTQVYIPQRYTDTGFCKGQTYNLKYGTIQTFRSGNVFTAQLSNASGSFASPTNIGSLTATGSGTISCTIPATAATGAGYRIRIVATAPYDTSYDNQFNIKIGPSLPTGVTATSNSPVCSPGTGLTLTGSSTTSSVTYYWEGPDGYFAASQNPVYPNPPLTASGNYILSVSNSGCTAKDTVAVQIKSTPAIPAASSNSPICEGAALNLTAASATAGVTYNWSGPGGYTSSLQNPSINPAVLANAGNYDLTVSLNGCTTAPVTTNVVVNRVTYVGIYASPNDTICEGAMVTFVAVPVNGGTAPTYQWYKNNTALPGETNITLVANSIANNDTFYCEMKVTGICISTLTLYSNKIGIAVLPITSSVVANVSSVPSPAVPGQPVTFSAAVVNGGQLPAYRWQRNGVDVGVTSQSWSTNSLHPYDKITCILTSSDPCANPKADTSAPVEVNFPLSVGSMEQSQVWVYPNPVSDVLYIENVAAHTEIQVVDMIGRAVMKTTINNSSLDVKALSPGNYLLILNHKNGQRNTLKFVKE